MGRKSVLSESERVSIVQQLAGGKSTPEIARYLSRDHRAIKSYIDDPSRQYTRPTGPYKASATARDATRLERAMSANPLGTSEQAVETAGVDMKSRSARCRVLKKIGKHRKATCRPKLTSQHKQRRLQWARDNMKMDSFKGPMDRSRVGPPSTGQTDGFRGWIVHIKPLHPRIKRQQGGGGVG
ncbi:hypothetical protein FOZ60_000745 [Perkinsus olseni]|uniref:Transposase Tc1-like domain-containing protein n=1 Tax=Perkinsus olseni TaxID=32597 RepID=A0A7J6P1K0_PEROL|nr:hypothetical protein FOZ60_000745 [Perkinsus olseni]